MANSLKKVKNDFLQSLMILLTGNFIAHIIPVIVSPILTRYYTPEEFGIFAIFISITSIAAVVATGAYEMAIVLPKKDSDAIKVTNITIFITFSFSIILFIIVGIFDKQINALLEIQNQYFLLYLIPVSVFFIGIYQSCMFWVNRKENYKTISKTGIIQSATASFSQMIFGFLGFSMIGLIIGRINGQIVSTIYLIKEYFSTTKDLKSNSSRIKNIALVKRYKKFPLYETFARLFNTSSNEIPIILLTLLFSSSITGFYLLANRVLLIPMTFLGISIGQVFLGKVSQIKTNKAKLKTFSFEMYKKLILISVVPVATIFVYGDKLFDFIFGTGWHVSGEIAQILSIMTLFTFISSHLTNIVIILEKQKESFVFNISLFITRTLSLVIGYYFFSNIYDTIVVYTVFTVFVQFIWLWFIFNKLEIRITSAIYELCKYFVPVLILVYSTKFI